MCLPPTPGGKCVKSLDQCAGTVCRGGLFPHPSLVSVTPPASYLTPLPCSSVSCASQVGHPKASTALTVPTVGGGHGRDLDTSPGVHCWGDLLGPTLPGILRNPRQAWIQAGLPLLITHPQLWELQGFTSLENHSLEGSREIAGCGGPDGDPWEAGCPRVALPPLPLSSPSPTDTLLRPGPHLKSSHLLSAAFNPVLKMPPN